MKKITLFFILFATLSWSNILASKYKNHVKKESKTHQKKHKKKSKKNKPKKLEKTEAKKDTTKLNKTVFTPPVKIDSLFIPKPLFTVLKVDAHASYYHDKFNGRKTASGKIFNNEKLTAAHKKLPFGTMVRVTNEKNNKSVIVEITDRGPYVKGRDIDLTRKAFMLITGASYGGSIKVKIEKVQK